MRNSAKNKLWIVTDLDGTLMDHNYDYSPALETIDLIKSKNIPLIFCTSKTASEVRSIRMKLKNIDPFIVENGAAIYGNDYISMAEWQIILGRSFKELRSILDKLSIDIGYQLTALNDLEKSKINDLTGLGDAEIELALDRHWSVPFLNPPIKYIDKLNKLREKYSINIYQGNRMSHLLDKGSHKGKAVTRLKEYLNEPLAYIVALGDSHNDLPLLEVADQAIVVPGINGPNKALEGGINNGRFLLSPEPHAKGWAISVNQFIESYI